MSSSRTAIDQAIAGLMKFTRRSPWAERFEALMEEFLERPAQEYECSTSDILGRVDDQGMGHMLYGMLLEQLMTLEYEDPPHNLIDDYLKRRGWKERPAGRAYLRQLRSRPPSPPPGRSGITARPWTPRYRPSTTAPRVNASPTPTPRPAGRC